MSRPLPVPARRLLDQFSDDVQEIALRLRDRVLAVMPNIHEGVFDVGYTVSLVYGATDRSRDSVVYIASFTKHVNLGFNQGALLGDADHVLVGTGSRMRHVKFHSVDQVNAKWIDTYLRAALAQAGFDSGVGDAATTVRPRANATS